MNRLSTRLLFALSVLLLGLVATSLAAQTNSRKLDDRQAGFYTGFSPIVLPDRGVEINFVNTLTSHWLALSHFDPVSNGTRVGNRYRFSSFDQLLRVSYGFSRSGRWDLGAEFYYNHRRIDDEARSSPLRVFETESSPTVRSDRGLSQIGLRARVVPLMNLPELTIQATYHLPMVREDTLAQFLGVQRPQLGIGAGFYQNFNSTVWYFLQFDWRSRLANNELDRSSHFVNGSGYLVFDLTAARRWFVFPGLSYATGLQANAKGGQLRQTSRQVLAGLGLQYQTDGGTLSLTLNGQLPLLLESGNSTVTWVRDSYSSYTLGLRFLL
jgi:hypothetical protein